MIRTVPEYKVQNLELKLVNNVTIRVRHSVPIYFSTKPSSDPWEELSQFKSKKEELSIKSLIRDKVKIHYV